MLTHVNLLRSGKNAEVDLNRVVTPMLDMTFQVLFFLIMNFRLPSAEGEIKLAFPKEDADSAPVAVLPEAPDELDEYVLRLYIAERGGGDAITEMKWRKKGQRIDDAAAEVIARVDPGDRNETDESLRKLNSLMYGLAVKLKPYQPREGGKAPTIKVECPAKLKYAEVLKVMDLMRKMNFKNVGLVPTPNE